MRRFVSVFESTVRWSVLALCALLPFFFIPLGGITPAESSMLLVTPILILAGVCLLAAYAIAGVVRAPLKAIIATAAVLPLLYIAYFYLVANASPEVKADALPTALLGSNALILAALVCARKREQTLALWALVSGGVLALALGLLRTIIPGIPVPSLSSETLYILVSVVIGIGIAVGGERHLLETSTFLLKHRRGWSRYTVPAALAVVTGAFVLSAALSFRNTLADVLIDRALFVYDSTNNIDASQALLRTALTVHGRDARAHRETVALGVRNLEALARSPDALGATTPAQLQEVISELIRSGLAAVKDDSGDYRSWLSLAELYRFLAEVGVKGAGDNARTAYERALALNPGNTAIRQSLSELTAKPTASPPQGASQTAGQTPSAQ